MKPARFWYLDDDTRKIYLGAMPFPYFDESALEYLIDSDHIWIREGKWKTKRPNIVVYDPSDDGTVRRFLIRKLNFVKEKTNN